MKRLFSLYNTQCRTVVSGRRETNEVIPAILLAFCLEALFQPTRREGPSGYDNLAEMGAKRSRFTEAEVAGIFEAESWRRGRYAEKALQIS